MPRPARPKGLVSNRRFDPKVLGSVGERRAAAWYQARGCEILDRNWRCPEGELDLVVEDHRVVVFVEVKSRSSDRYGSPFEAVDWRKQRKLRLLAAKWLTAHPSNRHRDVRFDVVAVVGTRVDVRESAF